MLSLASSATKLDSVESKAVNRFRPWWEILIFYCLNGLFMTVMFALAGVTISGTYQISCFPLGNNTALDYNTIAYANARCSRIFDGKYLIYFPHALFLEWAILFAVYYLWFKLPATFFLFQELSEIFTEFSSIKPVEYNTEKRQSRGIAGLTYRLTGLQLKENKETKEKIYGLASHLQDVLKRNNRMFWLYGFKNVFLTLSSAIIVIVLSDWLARRQWHASFMCDMSLHIPIVYKDMTCSLPAAPFLYGLMICNILLCFCICLCSIRAIVWLLTFNFFTYKAYQEGFGKWKFLQQQPGFQDFCFCLDLTTLTSKDGRILGDVIYSSLKVYQQSLKQTKEVQGLVLKPKFSLKFYQGQMIAQNLGLKVCEAVVTENSPLNAIANIIGEETQVVCGNIAKELLTSISVYKDLVDNDLNCPVFEDCIDLLRNERKCPKEFQHYMFMAACNAFTINIVVIQASSKCWYYKATNETSKAPTKFLLFIQPNYFTALENDPEHEDKHVNQQSFISDQLYRGEVKRKAGLSWTDKGEKEYKNNMETLYPKLISYGKTAATQEAKHASNILSDLFNEMGKISKIIQKKVHIPGHELPKTDKKSD